MLLTDCNMLLGFVGAYKHLRPTRSCRTRAAKGHFPLCMGWISDSSKLKRGVSVGGNASICSGAAPGWKACPPEQRWTFWRIITTLESCETGSIGWHQTAAPLAHVRRHLMGTIERLSDAVAFRPFRGTSRPLPVPQETRTIARRRI